MASRRRTRGVPDTRGVCLAILVLGFNPFQHKDYRANVVYVLQCLHRR